MHKFKELKVWQKSVDLATEIYLLTDKFPKKETFGLTSQIQRAAVSIPSNIAEGAGRNSKNEFRYFLGVALGSSFELETQIIIACKLSYCADIDELIAKIQEIQKMMNALIKQLK